jgi:hypothetical protein
MEHTGEPTAAEEIWKLKKQNERLTDDLFELLQPDNQVSEASLRNDYKEICDAIESWIDSVTTASRKVDFKRHYKEQLRNEKRRAMLRDLVFDPVTLGEYDNVAYVVLSLMIELQLEKYIFRRPYPIGITKKQTEVIEEIEECMYNNSQNQGTQASGLITI